MPNAPLVLVLDAQTKPLKTALKDAGTSLADYAKSAGAIMQEIQDAMQNDLANGAEDMAKRMTKSLQQQINTSMRLAKSAQDQGKDYNPLGAANSASSNAAADAQERLAKSFRDQAAAAAAANSADANVALGLRQVAVASELSAQEADRQAMALRKQAQVFAAIEAEMGDAADAGAGRVVGSHGRMGASSMMMMHSVRAASDSFAAGLPITTIFAEQISRLGEAAALSAAETQAAGGAASGFVAVMAEWAVPLVLGATVLGILVSHLVDFTTEAQRNAKALDDVKDGDDGVAKAQEVLGKMFDMTTGKLSSQNEMLRMNARLLADKLRAEGLSERETANQTLHSADGWRAGRSWGTIAMDEFNNNTLTGQTAPRHETDYRAQQLTTTLANVQAGKMTPDAAIKWGGNFNFDGLKIDKQAFLQGMLDSVSSGDKLKTADLIDQSLDQNKLAPALLKPEKEKKERKGPADHTAAHDSTWDLEGERLDQQEDDIKRKNVTDLTELARLDKEKVADELTSSQERHTALARQTQRSKADLDIMLAKDVQLAAEKDAAIDAKLKADLADQAADVAAKAINNQIAQLELADRSLAVQESLAATFTDRVKIQDEIRDNEKQIALLKIQEKTVKGKTTPAEAAQQTAVVNQEYAGKDQAAKTNNNAASQYLSQINKSSSLNMSQTLQSAEAEGLKSLTDGLAGVVTGTESVSGAFKKMATSIISDLARIEIQKLIVGLFGNGSSGGGTSIGSMIGGGSTSIDTFALGLADGGHVTGPGGPREDKIPAMLSAGEFVVNAAATRKHAALLQAINGGHVGRYADGGLVGADINYPRLPSAASLRSGGGSSGAVTFDLRGAVMTQDLLQQMNHISAQHAAGVLMTAPAMTQRNLAEQQRMRIPS